MKRVTVDGALGISMAAGDACYGEEDIPDMESFGVLPDPTRRRKLTWDEVRHHVPKQEKALPLIEKASVERLLELRDKKEFGLLSEEIWPPRTKTDVALRRTRLLDWVMYFRKSKRMADLELILYGSREGYDLIFVTNLLAATAVLGIDWYKRWDWLGAFRGDLQHYIDVAKRVNDLAKSTGIAEQQWTWFVECASLSGYRNTPFPGFDVEVEAEALAHGGEEHNYYGHNWDALVNEFLPMDYHHAKWTPFSEWVSDAGWLTSGASSVGRLHLKTADGKSLSLKARKNMLADVVDLEELADDTLTHRGQQNFTIIKSELGKLRLAVAGDIHTYLKMTWVNELLGGAYYDWPGNTSEENFEEQTVRLARMLELCSKMFGLPYDYAGFDHQPTTKEIVGIVKHLCAHARLNVPPHGQSEFDQITSSIIEGFYSATLETRLPAKRKELVYIDGDSIVKWPTGARFWETGEYAPFHDREAMNLAHMKTFQEQLQANPDSVILFNGGTEFAETYRGDIKGVVVVSEGILTRNMDARRAKGIHNQPTSVTDSLKAQAEYAALLPTRKSFEDISKPGLYMAVSGAGKSTFIEGVRSVAQDTKPSKGNNVLDVTGGLMSGLRWTSVIGNGWNSIITGLAMKLLTAWGIPTDQIVRFIRGDDSAIFVPNWATGAAMNLAYDAIGAKAGAGKFSLQDKQMEFLRVWFDTRCRGYPCRAIPGLTQRKPWSSNPWSEDMVLKALYEALRTLRRRVSRRTKEIDDVWVTLRHVWCVNHSLPDAVAWTPAFAGGFGIEPPPVGENWKIVPPVPARTGIEGIEIENQTSWREKKLEAYASERYGLNLGERARELAAEELLDTVKSDNIPAVATYVRQTWLKAVRQAGCRAFVTKVEVNIPVPPVQIQHYDPGQVTLILDRLRAYAPNFGKYPEVEIARADYTRFRPKVSFTEWLRKYFPRISVALRQFHKSWHISEKLDYLGGKIHVAPKVLHPALVKVLAWMVASVVVPKLKSVRCATLWAGNAIENLVVVSPISQKTYWW